MEKPVISIPTNPVGKNIDNEAIFTSPRPSKDLAEEVRKLGEVNIDNFVAHKDKSTLDQTTKVELAQAAREEIAWIKEKMAFKLRKPMWQTPEGKEKLLRMFNKFVQKRLNLIESLGEKLDG